MSTSRQETPAEARRDRLEAFGYAYAKLRDIPFGVISGKSKRKEHVAFRRELAGIAISHGFSSTEIGALIDKDRTSVIHLIEDAEPVSPEASALGEEILGTCRARILAHPFIRDAVVVYLELDPKLAAKAQAEADRRGMKLDALLSQTNVLAIRDNLIPAILDTGDQ